MKFSVFDILSRTTPHINYLETITEFLARNAIYLFGIVIFALICAFFCTILLRERAALKQKDSEQKIQQQYTDRLEQQQNAMQKFKHDFQNILTSIDGFVLAEDWDGLKQYMPKVDATSAVITKSKLAFEGLSKIKPTEIKTLLAEKLIVAQNINSDISVTIDVHDEIEHLPVDSVTLVRMLGIILDNAIEALSELGKGQLGIIVQKRGGGGLFVVQNDCAEDVPNLRQLKQNGFSTKGHNRGHGLSILSELTNSLPNVTLSTSINDGTFTQMLIVGGED